MGKHLLVGIGNPLRGDDALGWAAVEALQHRLADDGVECLCVQQLTMDLVETIHEADQVTFIDARAAAPAGELQIRSISGDSALDAPTSHFFDPGTLLAAIQALYGTHPPARLYTINAQNFDYGSPLSQPVQRAVEDLVAQLCAQFPEPQPAR